MPSPLRPILSAMPILLALLLPGCVDSSSQGNFTASQEQALHDPMHYSPNMDNTDITGGDIGHYDAQAMKRDVDDFWNP